MNRPVSAFLITVVATALLPRAGYCEMATSLHRGDLVSEWFQTYDATGQFTGVEFLPESVGNHLSTIAYDASGQLWGATENGLFKRTGSSEWTLVDDQGVYANYPGSMTFAPVPEPSTLVALSGLFGMGLIGRWWRRRKTA